METSNIEVQVYPIDPSKTESIRATVICRIYFSAYYIEVRGMKLFESKRNANGLFISFPAKSYKAKDGTTKYANYVFTNEALKAIIEQAAIKKYLNMPATTPDMPPITGDPPRDAMDGYDANKATDFKKPTQTTKPKAKDDQPWDEDMLD